MDSVLEEVVPISWDSEIVTKEPLQIVTEVVPSSDDVFEEKVPDSNTLDCRLAAQECRTLLDRLLHSRSVDVDDPITVKEVYSVIMEAILLLEGCDSLQAKLTAINLPSEVPKVCL